MNRTRWPEPPTARAVSFIDPLRSLNAKRVTSGFNRKAGPRLGDRRRSPRATLSEESGFDAGERTPPGIHVSRAISVNDLEKSLTGRGEVLIRRRGNTEQKAG
jgi:hypothetical protein